MQPKWVLPRRLDLLDDTKNLEKMPPHSPPSTTNCSPSIYSQLSPYRHHPWPTKSPTKTQKKTQSSNQKGKKTQKNSGSILQIRSRKNLRNRHCLCRRSSPPRLSPELSTSNVTGSSRFRRCIEKERGIEDQREKRGEQGRGEKERGTRDAAAVKKTREGREGSKGERGGRKR